jgi:tRNA modification GTPase
MCKTKKLILTYNKIDEVKTVETLDITNYANVMNTFISAKNKLNTDQLHNTLIQIAQIPEIGLNEVIVTNIRHFESLKNAYSAILRVQNGLQNNLPHDLLAQDIRECMHYLGEITGEITTDEVLGNIFAKFCIGK